MFGTLLLLMAILFVALILRLMNNRPFTREPNKQLQRTVMDKVPSRRAAAELRC